MQNSEQVKAVGDVLSIGTLLASLAEENNRHWKAEADGWRKRADEREQDFLPKNLGLIIAVLSIVAMLIAYFK